MAINIDYLLGWKSQSVLQAYTRKDVMFFALSLGVGEDPLDEAQLPYVYEKDLRVFPTFPTILCNPGPWFTDLKMGINGKMMVHAEQGLVLHRPLPVEGRVRGVAQVVDVIDKGEGKGALVYLDRSIYDDETGDKIATVKGMAFARADGGFGGKTGPVTAAPVIPERAPDLVTVMKTLPQQALFYRLNGDMNPLHADPAFARGARFDRPILHGLCTYGLAARAILAAYGDVVDIGARFSAPTYPGEDVEIALWRDGGEVFFRARVASRDAVVLNNGRAVLAEGVTR